MHSGKPLDPGAFYSEHHGWLFGWLRKKLGCAHHAADLAHDTFLRVMGSRELNDLDEPRAYLTTTAQRLMIDEARRKRIEQAYLAELALRAADIDLAPSPEQIVIAVEALMRFSNALDGLASKPRRAFLLRYLDERSNTEIAAELSVSIRMVHKYLVQALVHCHGALET
jgi:RNA polymerase sigma factor (sigma-70 family)